MAGQLSLFGHLLRTEVDRIFRDLAAPVKPHEVETLKVEIRKYLDIIAQAQKKNEFLNEPLARRIGETGILLLDNYHSYSKAHQSLIIGAVKYFLFAEEQDSDLQSPLGFDDDAEVMNFVLKKIGRDDLLIDIEGEF